MTKRLRPIAQTKFRLGGGRWLKVKIWPDVSTLTYYNNHTKRLLREGRVMGYVNGLYDYDPVWKEGKMPTRHIIHLALDTLDSGLWAHELQHFLADWCAVNKWNPTAPPWDEKAAYLAERLTRQFWSWYHREFPQVS